MQRGCGLKDISKRDRPYYPSKGGRSISQAALYRVVMSDGLTTARLVLR